MMKQHTLQLFEDSQDFEHVPLAEVDEVCSQIVADAAKVGLMLVCRKGLKFWALPCLRDFARNRFPDEWDADDFLSEAVDELALEHGIARITFVPFAEGEDHPFQELYFCEQGEEDALMTVVALIVEQAAQRHGQWKAALPPPPHKPNPPIPLSRWKTPSLERELRLLNRKLPHLNSKLLLEPSKKKQAKLNATKRQISAIQSELEGRMV